jgi:hypothetical protein
LENSRIVLDADADALRENEGVREFHLSGWSGRRGIGPPRRLDELSAGHRPAEPV